MSKEFFQEILYREIITKYLFIQSLKYKFGNDYIKTMYRIDPEKIIEQYNRIPKEKRKTIEDELEKQIDENKLDLNRCAVDWHRESLKNANRSNGNSKNEGEER